MSVRELVSGWFLPTDWTHLLICPECRFDYVRTGAVTLSTNGTNKDNTVVRIACEGECGHAWTLCLTFHKGQTFVHSDQITTMENPP
jgi:hypothetical protein